MKRLFDLIISLLGIIVLFPLFLLISILIILNNKGPIFYRQKRVGKFGNLFLLYKFRTMRYSQISTEGIFEPGNTTRITSVGQILRKTKLDELPQLINVLLGHMSFVGPRPEVENMVALYPERWEKILTVKPGITDNASIAFLNEEYILEKAEDPEEFYREVILPQKMDLYEDYVKNHTFVSDLKIILRTINAIIFK